MFELPEKILLDDFNGDWMKFENAVYQAFYNDFVRTKPTFRETKIELKSPLLEDGREYTFYHMVSSGYDESSRKPDLRRYERIKWAKPTIEQCDNWSLKVWPQERNGKNRICIWLELDDEPDYIVVLDVRKNYILLWTTFTLNYKHEKKKKMKEYQEFLKGKSR
ncbi:MAG: hypothetical protein WCR42_03005 [bacterium]